LTKHIFAVNMPNQLIETKPFDPLAGMLWVRKLFS
jgi:hypothetical protein